MTKPTIGRAAAALALAVLVGFCAPARAFECPAPQPIAKAGVIRETPAQIAELAPALSGADVVGEVPKFIEALRRRYPTAKPAELVNYLITAYCPAVQKAGGLTDAQKGARVDDFSKAVLAVLY